MAIDTTALNKLITDFRALSQKDSVSPESLGSLLQKLADLLASCPADSEVSNALNSVKRNITSLQSALRLLEGSAVTADELKKALTGKADDFAYYLDTETIEMKPDKLKVASQQIAMAIADLVNGNKQRDKNIAAKADATELHVVLASMGVTLDNVGNTGDSAIMYVANIGDIYYSEGHLFYKKSETETLDLGVPSSEKIYANAMTKSLYIWRGGTWRQCGTDAYTKAESDIRFAQLAAKADDVAYLVDFQDTNNIKKTGTVREATQSLVIAVGLLLLGDEQVKEELNSKIDRVDRELHVVLASMGTTLDNVNGGDGPSVDVELKIGDFFFDEGKKSIVYINEDKIEIDLGEPNDKKIYANAMTKRLYIWRGGTWRQCGTDAYTKAESDSRYYEKQATDTMLDKKVDKTDIVQSTGESTTAVMSQKAVSDALSNVYTKTESDARYLRGEVLYEDYYYPNMSPTTDTTSFTDSTEILQPTKFIESYTDADGTIWSNVFECESFPDWFDFSDKSCYPYGNGYSTGYLFLHNFAVENNGLVYDFHTLQNNNIGQKLPYYANKNGLGLKKIDATHFKVFTNKNSTTEFTAMNKANVDCSLFAFSPVTYNLIYDIDDCKSVRITLTGNIQSPSRYSSLLDGSCDVGLFGYTNRQVLYGDEYVEIEIDKNNNRWRQVKSGYSMFYRSTYSQNWSANKPESYESECRCLWSNIPYGTVAKICMINNKVCYSFAHRSNPLTFLLMGCKIKIEKLA